MISGNLLFRRHLVVIDHFLCVCDYFYEIISIICHVELCEKHIGWFPESMLYSNT